MNNQVMAGLYIVIYAVVMLIIATIFMVIRAINRGILRDTKWAIGLGILMVIEVGINSYMLVACCGMVNSL